MVATDLTQSVSDRDHDLQPGLAHASRDRGHRGRASEQLRGGIIERGMAGARFDAMRDHPPVAVDYEADPDDAFLAHLSGQSRVALVSLQPGGKLCVVAVFGFASFSLSGRSAAAACSGRGRGASAARAWFSGHFAGGVCIDGCRPRSVRPGRLDSGFRRGFGFGFGFGLGCDPGGPWRRGLAAADRLGLRLRSRRLHGCDRGRRCGLGGPDDL
ncbi:hypothetical protein THIOKS11730015 [Thiocapsa sp. KS1]|nr:hypothetical protein THIOKS11730015 [Thiocapsa sp. KS1]